MYATPMQNMKLLITQHARITINAQGYSTCQEGTKLPIYIAIQWHIPMYSVV